MNYLISFDDMCMSMQAIRDEVAQDEWLVILLERFSDGYDQIVKFIGSVREIGLFQASRCSVYKKL